MSAETAMSIETRRPLFMRRLAMRFAIWARQVRLIDQISVLVVIASLVSGGATYAALTGRGFDEPSSTLIIVLLNIDVFLLLVLTLLIGRRLLRLWVARKSGVAGSRLYVRLALLFGVMAVVPAENAGGVCSNVPRNRPSACSTWSRVGRSPEVVMMVPIAS